MAERKRKAIVIHSPHSGRSSQLAEAVGHLQDAGIEVAEQLPISDLDNLPPQGKGWQKNGIELAVAAGGDGLIGGVISHIAESELPLGILPLGTANDIARSLSIPVQLDRAARVIGSGQVQEVDVAVALPAEQAPHRTGKGLLAPPVTHVSPRKHGYFAHALTIGLNVQFARIATNIATRQRYGRLTYPISAIETLKYYDALDVSLHFEGLTLRPDAEPLANSEVEKLRRLSCRALQITVINAPIFGGQWQLRIPGASLYDRLLDIVVIEEVERAKLNVTLSHFFNSLLKNHQSQEAASPLTSHPAELSGIPGIHHFQAKGVQVVTGEDPRDATLDGEVRGQTPIFAHMADERLRVFVPGGDD